MCNRHAAWLSKPLFLKNKTADMRNSSPLIAAFAEGHPLHTPRLARALWAPSAPPVRSMDFLCRALAGSEAATRKKRPQTKGLPCSRGVWVRAVSHRARVCHSGKYVRRMKCTTTGVLRTRTTLFMVKSGDTPRLHHRGNQCGPSFAFGGSRRRT